uniref:Sodefrin-like factor n=1 Tax=Panagrolaimus sp. JU765 TaxID=591449 RepID=A0AC34QDG4_9BILA
MLTVIIFEDFIGSSWMSFSFMQCGKLTYTKHRDCALDDKPFDEENMTMTCSTSRCNSLKELPVNKTFFACYQNDNDGNLTLQTCSADDAGCFVEIFENKDEFYVYTAERGCANNTLVEQNMIHVCNSSLCNSPGKFPLDGTAMSCYVANGEEEEVKHRLCKLGAIGCSVETKYASDDSFEEGMGIVE